MEKNLMDRKILLSSVRRVVVKVGTNLIIGKDATENKAWLLHFTADMVALQKKGIEVVIVSSGAIGAGMYLLGIPKRPKDLPMQQACAAVGQNRLMQIWERLFRRHKTLVGQVLLTIEDFKNRKRYLNLRHTFHTLLSMGVIPIVNENDSIAVEEIKVGDNDTLSAYVTNFVEADLLVLLTDTEGLYCEDPKKNPKALLLSEVEALTPQIWAYCGTKGSETSVGGMRTNLVAADIVTRSGEMMLIANGYKETVSDLLDGKKAGTLFLPSQKSLSSRKQWIAFGQKAKGIVYVDEGGAAAISKKGKSLLPVGVKKVECPFQRGDIIGVYTLAGVKIARGVTNYSSEQILRIMGKKSGEIAAILGQRDYEEVIHRDNMVLENREG